MKYIITFILLLFIYALYSQDTIRLKEVVVEDKFEHHLQIYYTDTLRQHYYQNQTLGNFMAYEPGITLKSEGSGGIQGISIRGTQNSHSQINWYGLPVNSSLNGQTDYSLLTVNDNSSIHILYGINSLQYENGGIGGIITLQSLSIDELENKTTAMVNYQSLKNQFYSISNTFKIKNSAITNTLSYSSGKNYFRFMNEALLPQKRSTNEALFSTINYFNQWLWKNKKNKISLFTNIFTNDRDIPPLMTSYYMSEHKETQADKGFRSILLFQHDFKKIQFKQLYGFSFSYMDYQLYHSIQNTDVTIINSNANEHIVYIATEATYSFTNRLRSQTKINWQQDLGQYQNLKEGTGFYKTRNQFSLNQSLIQNWNNQFKQSVIIHIYNYQKDISCLPALISTYFITPHISISHSIGINQHIPSLNDMFFLPGGNAELKPEQAFQTELTFKFNKNEHFVAQLNPYYQQIKNWIMWTPSSFGYWQATNIREIQLYGYTANITFKFNINPSIELYSNINYTYSKAKGNDGYYTILHNPYIPTHQINFTTQVQWKKLQWYIESQGFSTRYTMTYIDDYYLLPYQIWNTDISYTLGKKCTWHFTFGLKNIFNVSYQSIIWRPMPGRHIDVSIKITLP